MLSLTPGALDLGSCFSQGTLTVGAAGGALTWQASSSDKNVTLSPAGPATLTSGGSTTFTATASRPAELSGSTTITVTTKDGQQKQATVLWEQSWTLSTSSLSFGPSTGTSLSFSIIPNASLPAGCPLTWQVTSDNPSVVVKPSSGGLGMAQPGTHQRVDGAVAASNIGIIVDLVGNYGSQGSANLTVTTSDGQAARISVSWNFPIIG